MIQGSNTRNQYVHLRERIGVTGNHQLIIGLDTTSSLLLKTLHIENSYKTAANHKNLRKINTQYTSIYIK